ncbi:hypothetical protein FHT82_000545 [Rhizobium sp. BK275]|nr:hypothetical protein [Rhizobium sp. BK275]MBB3407173.1 hypothetical protein [Rhizobium sp. BK316]
MREGNQVRKGWPKAGKGNAKKEIEELRGRVPCSAVLEKAGCSVDLKESTPRAVRYRRDSEIIIVIHEGQGWFDPLSDAKAMSSRWSSISTGSAF